MKITRISSFSVIVTGLMLGGCAGFQPSPVVMKNQVEPVMRTQGAAMTADRYYQAGRSAMRSGDLLGARQFFAQALLQDPNYVDAINAMAAILTVQGRYADSLELMRQAVERAPDDAMYRRNLERVEKLVARERAQPSEPTPVAEAAAAGGATVVEIAAADATVAATTVPASVVTIDEAGSRPLAGDTVAVVEVAPNVYRLQVPEYRMAGAARDAAHPRPIAEAMAAGRNPSRASPAATLSAPWMRTAESMPSRPAEEARSRVAPSGRLTPVSYKRDVHAPAQMRVMVTNGMGREGWAARHAGLLGAMGMTPARITNHRHYGVERTLIRYREGLLPEAERIIGAVATLGNAELVADDSLPAGIDLQVILGKDSQPVRHGPTT